MCTVVFIPNQGQFIMASLRDEDPNRLRAIEPNFYTNEMGTFLAPKDPLANGTWIGARDTGTVVILLNGGFKNHSKLNNYKLSRGLIVTELLNVSNIILHWSNLDLYQVEPFTLVVWEDELLFHLVWDGASKHKTQLNITETYIWSSATLYTYKAAQIRQSHFNAWLGQKPTITNDSLLGFFNAVKDAENGFIINRNNNLKTLSYSYLNIKPSTIDFSYLDLFSSKEINKTIEIMPIKQII